MWNKLPATEYFISCNCSGIIKFLVTDFTSIWFKNFGTQEFATILKESNRHLEIEESVLLTKAEDMLQRVETLTEVNTICKTDNSLLLKLVRMEGFPLKLNVCLMEGSKDLFFNEVTKPLLQTVNDLRTSEKKLCQLLLRKDKEIKEYKEEGGKIALRHLRTPLFDEGAHKKMHSSYSQNFGFGEMPSDLLNKSIRLNAIKKEPVVVVKQENLERTATTTLEGHDTVVKQESTSSLEVKQEPLSQSQSSAIGPRKRKKMLNV